MCGKYVCQSVKVQKFIAFLDCFRWNAINVCLAMSKLRYLARFLDFDTPNAPTSVNHPSKMRTNRHSAGYVYQPQLISTSQALRPPFAYPRRPPSNANLRAKIVLNRTKSSCSSRQISKVISRVRAPWRVSCTFGSRFRCHPMVISRRWPLLFFPGKIRVTQTRNLRQQQEKMAEATSRWDIVT